MSEEIYYVFNENSVSEKDFLNKKIFSMRKNLLALEIEELKRSSINILKEKDFEYLIKKTGLDVFSVEIYKEKNNSFRVKSAIDSSYGNIMTTENMDMFSNFLSSDLNFIQESIGLFLDSEKYEEIFSFETQEFDSINYKKQISSFYDYFIEAFYPEYIAMRDKKNINQNIQKNNYKRNPSL